MSKYSIIGGQYNIVKYGESDSLNGAKCIAQKNKEYWDNWKGWHIPAIYKTEDVETIGTFHEQKPIAEFNMITKKWD